MNERIEELEAQCWEPRQYGPAWFNSKKFAELIVRECITKVEFRKKFAVEDEHNIGDEFDLLVYDIKTHFGVEE